MSENSLIIREKYISKLFKKIQELEEGIDLLGKVDRRILKKNIQSGGAYLDSLETRARHIQTGGAEAGSGPSTGEKISLKGIQEAALIAKSKIRSQSAALEQAAKDIQKLTANTAELRSDLANLTGLVKSIKIGEIPDLKSSPIDVSSYTNMILYNAFNCVPWNSLVFVEASLSEEAMGELLDKKPEAAGLRPASPEERIRGIGSTTEIDYNQLCAQIGSCPGSIPVSGSGSVSPPSPGGSARAPASMAASSASGLGSTSPSGSRRGSTSLSGSRRGLSSPPAKESNKYYSNSVTSTELPDNDNMFSETSFF